ncbi:cell wall hydrolase [Caulobacter sp. 17J65-9]|nr:cell wall hydrolase [Caulobacter sp. 17J65-9]
MFGAVSREQSRALGALGGAATAMAVLATALSASSSPGPAPDRAHEHILKVTGGSLSEDALKALAGGMDPAARALAARHDPAAEPQEWGRVEGWPNYDVSVRPDLGIGALDGDRARQINALIPIAAGELKPARPFVFQGSAGERKKALRCLTQAVYYESALESDKGQAAVAQVVLNRVRDPNFPASVCGVVFQGAERTTGCQFSFTCDGAMAGGVVPWAWDRAKVVAERALAGQVVGEVGTATHYHADYVLPWWSPTVRKVGQIGTHIFYRWAGNPGEPAAFVQRYAGREPVIDEARFARPRLPDAEDTVVLASEDGHGRVAMVLGGRRKPTADDIARINEKLRRFESETPTQGAAPKDAAEEPASPAV